MMAAIGHDAGLPDGPMAVILHTTRPRSGPARRSPLPRILGHRGARLVAPENTLPGFQAAISDGADGVELDIRRTADEVLVCLHDAGLGRTTNGRGPVREHTLAEIRRLDASGPLRRNGHRGLPRAPGVPRTARGASQALAGAPPGAPASGDVRVPTLSEALDALPPSALVDVEVKCRGEGPEGPARVADLLAATLAGRPDRDRILVSSFSRKLVAAAVPALEGISVGLVSSALTPLGRALRAAETCGCSLLAAQASAYFGPMARLAAARAVDAGLQLLAWTVDDPETARRLADLGVSVIVSDRPGQLRRALDSAR
jgi:glycerophosphoryl diester phosphodiesterase